MFYKFRAAFFSANSVFDASYWSRKLAITFSGCACSTSLGKILCGHCKKLDIIGLHQEEIETWLSLKLQPGSEKLKEFGYKFIQFSQ
ncbi:hypothetical protein A8135_04420 [Legionella jamestowniensis]|uniref:Uncharacterized protein n=1 Tax=Legionella jamestowniensis TaxID=455 RepID=A0ABX2XY96_9GAMM|nr:hypothetical protein [Legionella jamestowniensis]OCH96890.1 hypothetical protein A8135_04420 [Legionella jamestowniensis]